LFDLSNKVALLHEILGVFLLFLIASVVCSTQAAKVTECEVCEKVIEKLRKQLPDDAKPEEIEIQFKEFCKTAVGKEEKFCYYIGGLETSATYIVPEMTRPMSWNMPADKICREKLLKKDPQVCDLRYDKQIDVNAVDLKKLKVKDLKKILSDWGEDSKDCVEKSDFIRKIESLKPKYAASSPKTDL